MAGRDLDPSSVIPQIEVPLRLRALMDAYFTILLILVLIATAAAGVWVYDVHLADEIQEDQQIEVIWTESTSYEHSSVVVNDTLPFEEGERMVNRPMYYTAINDDLHIDYNYEYDGADGSLTVSTESYLLFQAVQGEETLWEFVVPIASATTEGMAPGENHSKRISVNIEEIFQTLAQIEQDLGSRGTTELIVVTAASVEGEVDGEPVSQQHDTRLQFTVNPEVFRVLEIETYSQEHTDVEIVEIVDERSLFEQAASATALAFTLLLLMGLIVGRRSGILHISEDEREVLELRQQEEEFSEWITGGTFPAERDYDTTILVDDLEGIVDVAIDINKRVIKDDQLGVATVLDDDHVYIYVWPDSPAGDWLVNYADMTMEEFQRYDL